VPTVEPEGLSDPEVLELTAAEGRVLVTASLRDFEPISREWPGEECAQISERGDGMICCGSVVLYVHGKRIS
jgi:hypothetical protein